MKITLIRHGESVANAGNFISDDPKKPVGLTDKGRAQAAARAESLRKETFTHAFASEFPRAQQTAQILLQYHSLELQIDARLNERKSGLDGQPVHLFNDQVRLNPLHFRTPHGETFLEQMVRVKNFLDEMAQQFPAARILAVSHENPIIAALALTVEDPATVVFQNLENCGQLDIDWQ